MLARKGVSVDRVYCVTVTGAAEVEETVFGPSGIVEGAQSGLFVVDATTSEVSSSTKTREALAKRGIIFVDAPLTRTPAAAELGKASMGTHAHLQAPTIPLAFVSPFHTHSSIAN